MGKPLPHGSRMKLALTLMMTLMTISNSESGPGPFTRSRTSICSLPIATGCGIKAQKPPHRREHVCQWNSHGWHLSALGVIGEALFPGMLLFLRRSHVYRHRMKSGGRRWLHVS
ncbi:hypothetical protein DFJ77DRAFT_473275 [Powellomyces hirtus]|nr:hypothetical protein DFJ77DRAFT_473275 [Powellomyces hirtus]